MGCANSLYQFGGFRLDPRGRTLLGPDGPVAITAKAFDALVFLVEHAGELVERPTLVRLLWPKTIVEDNNLNQTIAALRRVLGDGHIATIPGRGYQFVVKVAVMSDPKTSNAPAEVHADLETVQSTLHAAPRTVDEELPEALTTLVELALEKDPAEGYQTMGKVVVDSQAATAPAASSRSRIARRAGWAALVVGAAVFGALLVGGVAWLRSTPNVGVELPAPETVAAAAASPRIAILPFENLSPDPSNAFFTDGLHDEVLTTLANSSPNLEVISRTTMMLYRTASKPVTEIAAELGAAYVLSGSVRREGDAVRLSLQLVDASSDGVLMTETYNKTLTSALTLQSEVAQEVAQRLSARVAGLRPAVAPTADPEAYDLFLKAKLARQGLNGSFPIDAWLNVERLLNEAVARDPQFARAYVARSELRARIFWLGYDTSDSQFELARADLAAVQRLEPGQPATLAAEALLAEDPAQAIELFEAAERAGLTDPDLLLRKAGALIRAHRVREGVELMSGLSALDPGNTFLSTVLWFNLVTIREPARALQTLAAAEARSPNILWAPLRAGTLFSFTGSTEPLAPWSDPAIIQQAIATGGQDPGDALRNVTDRLLLRERYHEARDVIDSVAFDEIRLTLFSYFTFPGTQMPTADMRGWTNLLLGDAAEAVNDGRRMLAFLERTPATPAAAWVRLALSADARTFLGERSAAITDARAMLSLTEAAQDDPNVRAIGQMLAARVFAWAGEPDAAIDLLERLAVEEPGLPPADVVRDPRYSVPLRDQPRFRALAARLDRQMAATRLY